MKPFYFYTISHLYTLRLFIVCNQHVSIAFYVFGVPSPNLTKQNF